MSIQFKRTNKYWRSLPYGMWTLHDGSEILFDREYNPLIGRSKDKLLYGVDQEAIIQDIATQSWFYDDFDVVKKGRGYICNLGADIFAVFTTMGAVANFVTKQKAGV